MIMKKHIFLFLSCLTLCLLHSAAQNLSVQSVIKGSDGQPIEGALITIKGKKNTAISDGEGHFKMAIDSPRGIVTIKAEGYYEQSVPVEYLLNKKDPIVLASTTDRLMVRQNDVASTLTMEKKDFTERMDALGALGDLVPGLQVTGKSGMPGEGSYVHMGGVHSMNAETTPLIVVNGVPYFASQDVSGVAGAYSRDMLMGFSPKDIRSVSILKGADAAAWGSLGSNGVILIETQQATSDNLETRISFGGQYGLSFRGKSIPVLDASEYRSYMQDIGMTRYSSMTDLRNDYPFLQSSSNYDYLFNDNTDWMKEVSRTGFQTDNLFRVEGGDAIAKYNISFGYTKNEGTLHNSSTDKYHSLISADIMASRKVDIFANVGLAYVKSQLQNTGMNSGVSPILSSYLSMPLISPYAKEATGGRLHSYAAYDAWNVSESPVYAYDNMSNALALVNTVDGKDKIYDANTQIGINIKANDYLSFKGLFNMYYNYTEETMFIPGVSSRTILPQVYGTGLNMVATSTLVQSVYNYQAEARYARLFAGVHDLDVLLRGRYMIRNTELDASEGYNTAGDSYTTLDNTNDEQQTVGDNTIWKYMGWNLSANYTYSRLVKAKASLALDRASVTGVDAPTFALFPSAGVVFMAANTGKLPSWVDRLDISLEGSMSGNSRFSSNYAKNYYVSQRLFNMGGIVRSNMPNTKLQMERKRQLDFGLNLQLLGGMVELQANYFTAENYDLLLNRDISEVYGTKTYYDNSGSITNSGIDLALRITPINTKDWTVTLGANASLVRSRVKSLGGDTELLTTYTSYDSDDARMMMRVGETPWQFYGYQTAGVYATTEAANAANLKNAKGDKYRAGDVIFVDQNGDGMIDDEDMVCLGSSLPSVYGGINLHVRYKQWELNADFGYTAAGKLYNATRRQLVSMSTFHNQATAVLNRWQVEGQQTDMPRADYGDTMGNNKFSDRWIEDGDYLKLRNLRLSYSFGKLLGVIRSGNVYVAGENLFCLTNYLGSDPEYAYSYDESLRGFDYAKLALPVTVKIGFNLNF